MSLNGQGFINYLNILIMKNLLNLGKALNKTEQKEVFGGRRPVGISDGDCNQQQQSQIPCNPWGNSSECELDAVCGSNSRCVCV